MKTFLWLLTIAFTVLCCACWCVAEVLAEYVRNSRGSFDLYALPAFAVLILPWHAWILLCPLPWAVYATVLSRRREIAPATALIFAGTLGIGAVVILSVVTIGSIVGCVPFMPPHVR